MRTLRPVVVGVALLVAASGCRTAPIHDVTNAPLPSSPARPLTTADVARAIAVAGKRLGWVVQEVRPGELTGTLTLRRHVAVVTITHDTSTFSIRYKDSQGLRHDGNDIHRNYNNWVENLAKHIQVEVGQVSLER